VATSRMRTRTEAGRTAAHHDPAHQYQGGRLLLRCSHKEPAPSFIHSPTWAFAGTSTQDQPRPNGFTEEATRGAASLRAITPIVVEQPQRERQAAR
jgi:hypothetical protein